MPRLNVKVLGKTFVNRYGITAPRYMRRDYYIISCLHCVKSFLGFSHTRRRHNRLNKKYVYEFQFMNFMSAKVIKKIECRCIVEYFFEVILIRWILDVFRYYNRI